MKKFLMFTLIFLLLIFNAYGIKSAEYMPGEVIVKLKQNSDNIIINSAGIAETGTSIDELNSKYKVTKMEKLLEKHEKSKKALASFKKHGLDRIFLLKISKNVDLNEAVRDFNNNPNVEYAEPNYVVNIALMPTEPQFSLLYGLHNTGQTGGTPDADIDAPEAWGLQTGSNNVLIAVIDTGVDYNHEDLAANIWANPNEIPNNGVDDDANGFVDDSRGWDFYNNDNNPFDDHGHGTHVSGTIGATGNNGIGVVGVDWNVKIVPIKFLGSGGSGTTAGAISSVQYATLLGVNIMSNSWGGGGFSQALKDAISAANDAGILFVAAAGNANNNNDANPFYPASYDVPNIVAVAATDHNDLKASFSNYGVNSVHLGAPGVNIFSTVPTGPCSLCSPSGYTYLSGTSMATPHVSGVAGLIKAQFPSLTSNGIKARLLGGVDLISSMGGITVTGGRLNAFNALKLAEDTIPPAAVTDLTTQNATFSSVTLAWTATGDDGNVGTASSYDIRYATSPITETSWNTATKAIGEPQPRPANSRDFFTVNGLAQGTTYYFALIAIDDAGNPSGLSNLASETTKALTTIFADNMENGINGWSSDGLWHQETKRAYSLNTSWAYNNGAPFYNYDMGANSGSLTSQIIDLSAFKSAVLKLKFWYQTETPMDRVPPLDMMFIQIGVNNSFSNLGQIVGPALMWSDYNINISQYAGKPNVQARFFFDTIDGLYNSYEGWYIDDVSIVGEIITKDNAPPTVFILSPANGSYATGVITVNATASDNNGIAKVEFYLDNDAAPFAIVVTSPYITLVNTTNIADGTHILKAKAYDAAENYAVSSPVSIIVDNTPPIVYITSPADGSTVKKRSSVTIAASASDGISGVNYVDFFVNSALKCRDNNAPYTCLWTVPPQSNAVYKIQAIAYDNVGLNGLSPTITVKSKN